MVRRRWATSIVGSIVALSGVIVSNFVAPIAAQAANTCIYDQGGSLHCYSEKINAEQLPPYNHVFVGISATFPDAALNPGDALHMNTTIWISIGGTGSQNIEMGICDDSSGGPCPSYGQYWAVDGYIFWWRPIAVDNATHTYMIQSSAYAAYYPCWAPRTPPCWTFYIDNSPVGQVGNSDFGIHSDGSWNGMNAGGEIQLAVGITQPDQTQSTGNQAITGLGEDYAGYGRPAWYPWQYWSYRIDYPCGQYSQSICLNGASYAADKWSWNKP